LVAMIGVLDLQGGVAEHFERLRFLGVSCCLVKKAEQLRGLNGLIIPGGESTCLSRLMKIFALDDAIIEEHRRGMKIWGTCAGAILLASNIIGEKPCLDLLDITIERNSFGSQLDSFTRFEAVPAVAKEPITLVFIRAPKIVRLGDGVKILLAIGDYIAAVESDKVLATVFHPELSNDNAFHRYFAVKCGVAFDNSQPIKDPNWRLTSWMSAWSS